MGLTSSPFGIERRCRDFKALEHFAQRVELARLETREYPPLDR